MGNRPVFQVRKLVAMSVLAMVLIPTGAGAMSLSSPASGSTVGRTVTITGNTGVNCELNVLVDQFADANSIYYIRPEDRAMFRNNAGSGIPAVGKSNENGGFSLTLQLQGSEVILPKNGQLGPLSAGWHTFRVRAGLCVDNLPAEDSEYSDIILNVQDRPDQASNPKAASQASQQTASAVQPSLLSRHPPFPRPIPERKPREPAASRHLPGSSSGR